MRSVIVGETEIYSVSDGRLRFPKKEFFADLEESDWKPYKDYSKETIDLNIGSFIVKTRSKTILIDTGLGKLDQNNFMNSAEAEYKKTLTSSTEETKVETAVA